MQALNADPGTRVRRSWSHLRVRPPLGPQSESWPIADGSDLNGWAVPATPVFDDDRMPTAVLVASILTGLASTLTIMVVALAGLVLGRAATAILEAFDVEHPHAWVWGTLAGLAAMCVASTLCAILVTRRSRVARWALVALSALSIAVSTVLAFTIVISIANALAAGTVLVLLLVPEAGRWFARPAP